MGFSPWGIMGTAHQNKGYYEDKLIAGYDSGNALKWGTGASGISQELGAAYQAPDRVYKFNEDLLTNAGTPPFTPFGVTSTGTGAWVNYPGRER